VVSSRAIQITGAHAIHASGQMSKLAQDRTSRPPQTNAIAVLTIAPYGGVAREEVYRTTGTSPGVRLADSRAPYCRTVHDRRIVERRVQHRLS